MRKESELGELKKAQEAARNMMINGYCFYIAGRFLRNPPADFTFNHPDAEVVLGIFCRIFFYKFVWNDSFARNIIIESI